MSNQGKNRIEDETSNATRDDQRISEYGKPTITDYGRITPRLAFSPPPPPGKSAIVELPPNAKGPP